MQLCPQPLSLTFAARKSPCCFCSGPILHCLCAANNEELFRLPALPAQPLSSRACLCSPLGADVCSCPVPVKRSPGGQLVGRVLTAWAWPAAGGSFCSSGDTSSFEVALVGEPPLHSSLFFFFKSGGFGVLWKLGWKKLGTRIRVVAPWGGCCSSTRELH